MKITFKIHFLFFISALFCFMTGLFKDFIIFTSIILIHELGHITSALIFNWPIEKIILLPFGGLTIFNQKINSSLLQEFIIAIAGPIFQIVFFLTIGKNSQLFTYYHYAILFFNLIPIYPLDGFKILNIILNKIISFKYSYLISLTFSIINFLLLFTYIFFNKLNFLFLLIIFFLIKAVVLEYKNFKYLFNKFLFERYLYNIKYKKEKRIKGLNLSLMYREKSHIFKIKNNYVLEDEILNKMFDINR